MNHNRLKAAITIALYFIASIEGFDIQRRTWPPMIPSYGQNPYQQEILLLREVPFKKPSNIMRPMMTRIDFKAPLPSHVQEYPLSPYRSQSRVIVAKTQTIDLMKNFQIPMTDKLESVLESKDFMGTTVSNPISKIEELKEMTMDAANPEEKVVEMKDAVAEKGENSIPVFSDMKEATMQKLQLPKDLINKDTLPLENIEDLKPMPVGLLDSTKDLAIEKSLLPIQKAEDLKDVVVGAALTTLPKSEDVKAFTLQRIELPFEKIDSLKDTLIETPIQKLEALKDMATEMLPTPKFDDLKETDNVFKSSLQKVEDTKNIVLDVTMKEMMPMEKGNDLKGELLKISPDATAKPKDVADLTLSKLETMKEATVLPLELGTDLKDKIPGVSSIIDKKDDAMEDGIDKAKPTILTASSLKDDIVETPVIKLEDMKDMVTEKTLEKVEDLKDMDAEKALEKFEDLKDTLNQSVAEKIMLPVETGMNIKGTVIGAPVEAIKAEIDEKATTIKNVISAPLEKLVEGVEMIDDKVPSPIIMGSLVKDAVNDKVGIPLEMMDNSKNITGLVQLPFEKLLIVKEAPLEKLQMPLQITEDLKEAVADKNVLNMLSDKMERIVDPKQDLMNIVFNAIRQSITGNRKEFLKQFIGAMNKSELDKIHETLLNEFNLGGFTMPKTAENNMKEDLKEAVHELAMSGEGGIKKETLMEIERVLDLEKDKPSVPPVIFTKDEILNKSMTIVPISDKLVDTSEKIEENKGIIEFTKRVGRIQNMSRLRRWGISPSQGKQTSYRQHNHMRFGWGRGKRSIYSTTGIVSQELQNFPPPARLHQQMKTTFRQINSAGPPEPYARSKESLSLPFLSNDEPATDRIMEDIKEGLQYILQTKNEWTFPIHGTATTGCNAVLDNLIESGDKVLALIVGYWGELMAQMSERLDAKVVRYNKPPGTVFTLKEIESAIKVHRPNLVVVVQGESSTAVKQPLEGIGDLCEKNGALLIADVVAVAGIQPVLLDENKIDAAFTSSHKGLGGVVGLSPISLSPKAVQKLYYRKNPPRGYQTDLRLQAVLWNTSDPDRVKVQSMSEPLMYALREALATIAEERMENTFKRHALTTEQLNRGLIALGLEHFVENPKDRLIAITAVKNPTGKDPAKISNYMFKNHNIEISTGFGPTKGKVLRFATFAANADALRVNNLLVALEDALRSSETNTS